MSDENSNVVTIDGEVFTFSQMPVRKLNLVLIRTIKFFTPMLLDNFDVDDDFVNNIKSGVKSGEDAGEEGDKKQTSSIFGALKPKKDGSGKIKTVEDMIVNVVTEIDENLVDSLIDSILSQTFYQGKKLAASFDVVFAKNITLMWKVVIAAYKFYFSDFLA